MIKQPGAVVGDSVACPVSGAVFTISEESPTRRFRTRPVHFCCAACAAWFDGHARYVAQIRGW